MRVHRLADALKDFGVRPLPVADPFEAMSEAGEPSLPVFDAVETPALPDTDELIANAVAQAEAELAERLENEHAQTLLAERERHAEEVSELQRQFADEAGERILAEMGALEARLTELTTAVTARILGGVLTDDVRERSLDRLGGLIREALADNEAVRIRVNGSLPLYEALKQKLPGHEGQLDFTESAYFDLSVTIDDSVFETRLGEWSASLAEALS